MDIETWAHIRYLFHQQKLSKSEIARQLGLDRKTVRTAVATEQFLGRQRARRSSKLDPFKPDIQRLLADYPKLSAVRKIGVTSLMFDIYSSV